ncbi:hypothetical protein KQX54_008888 [Cotesia glomerata]|uniref:Uncharacterized protein n=1 Tax=Cotesia glomerata TaxID=32391 RepID=A0AAV7IU06_COTGL|nr:hypothetical protein KQX54_008888 [Cotesia glomerata]
MRESDRDDDDREVGVLVISKPTAPKSLSCKIIISFTIQGQMTLRRRSLCSCPLGSWVSDCISEAPEWRSRCPISMRSLWVAA